MEKYAIVHRPDETSFQLTEKIKKLLNETGRFEEDDIHPHTVIVVGGDGTFIYAVHHFLEQLDDIRFYGIHTGTLGFYTDYRDCDFDEFMETLLMGKGDEITYPLLCAETEFDKYYGINEIRVENASITQKIEVLLDDEPFETFRGTGMCICTQLGSTAYNRSLGGAVIDEGLDIIQMTEMSGIHHAKSRSLYSSIVLKSSTKVTFRSDSFRFALLGTDSTVYNIDDVKEIKIHLCTDKVVHMLRGRKVSYHDRLKSLF